MSDRFRRLTLLASRRALIAAAITVLALVGLPTSASARTVSSPKLFVTPQHYVALGDSYTSGPLIPVQRNDPIGCLRSTHNYPALLAKTLQIHDYTDASCSGATTGNMTDPQLLALGINPPQFSALRPDTDLVTLTISGNDVGFLDILATCIGLSATNPLGNPCQRQATAGGIDRYAQRIAATAPRVAQVLEGIRARSPRATVLLVGYLRILPPTLGCYPIFPIARGDVPYVDGLERRLTAMLADQAGHHGAVFVNSYANSLGRDACQRPRVKWVEAIVPTGSAFPVHPDARGMHAVTRLALDTLRGPGG